MLTICVCSRVIMAWTSNNLLTVNLDKTILNKFPAHHCALNNISCSDRIDYLVDSGPIISRAGNVKYLLRRYSGQSLIMEEARRAK